jgi:hypothetical protein
VEEIEPEYIKGLKFHYVDRMGEVLALALGDKQSKALSNGTSGKKSRGKAPVVR